jgi:signal transduction histidine kinase
VSGRDALLPLAIAAVVTAEAVSFGPPRLLAVLLIQWLACTLLVLRRRWPLASCTAAMLVPLPLTYLGPVVNELAAPLLVVILAGFSLARYLPDLRGLFSMALVAVAVLAYPVNANGDVDVTDVVFVAAVFFPPYGFGLLMRTLADRTARLAEQAELLTRLQATVREDATSAERSRIARELHDVLAHSVSAMVVQATAAEDLVERDPARAAAAMHEVAHTGRRALSETGRLLHLIRDTEDELGLEPDLGLDRLPDLVGQFQRSGLDVEVSVDGPLDELPPGVDVSAYRIVQEALTNALKYAHDHQAALRVQREPAELRIEVDNRGRPQPSTGSGLGLVGMAERVSVYGGRLEHGFTRDGRFTLSAVLPLQRVEA